MYFLSDEVRRISFSLWLINKTRFMGFLAVLIKKISFCFVIHSCASSCGSFKDNRDNRDNL